MVSLPKPIEVQNVITEVIFIIASPEKEHIKIT